MSEDQARVDRRLDAPSRSWHKVVGFAIGLAAAGGAYLFVAPKLPSWRSWVLTHLSSSNAVPGAATAPAVAVGDASAGGAAAGTRTPSRAANVDEVTVADRQAKDIETHQANRSVKRHRSRHRRGARQ